MEFKVCTWCRCVCVCRKCSTAKVCSDCGTCVVLSSWKKFGLGGSRSWYKEPPNSWRTRGRTGSQPTLGLVDSNFVEAQEKRGIFCKNPTSGGICPCHFCNAVEPQVSSCVRLRQDSRFPPHSGPEWIHDCVTSASTRDWLLNCNFLGGGGLGIRGPTGSAYRDTL